MCCVRSIYLLLLLIYARAEVQYTKTARIPALYNPFPRTQIRECNTQQIDDKLSKFEVQIGEKYENLNSELREANLRLEALEQNSKKVLTALEALNDVIFGVLAPDIQLIGYSIGAEIDILKRNLTDIKRAINVSSDNLATKQDLSTIISEMKQECLRSNMVAPSGNKSRQFPRSCKEILEKDKKSESGLYKIQPEMSPESFEVLCDMTTKGGGWTYIHNRFDGSQDFDLNWNSYQNGFGNLTGEFWLGLEHIYYLTEQDINELLIELVDHDDYKAYAYYNAFSIGSKSEGYPLKLLGKYNGTAGDSLSLHAGYKFTTKDYDLDTWDEGNCAVLHRGPWWYKDCNHSNLNGLYFKGTEMYKGMTWTSFRGPDYSYKAAKMMIRERSSSNQPVLRNDVEIV